MGAFDDLQDSPKKGGAFGDLVVKQAPLSRTDKFLTGITDPIHGGAQMLTKVLPESVVSAGNAANNWLADNTGLVARLPDGGVDQAVRERESAYQAQRQAAGESGFDGYRVIGNVVSPANAALAMRGLGAATTGARVAGGALTGGASALMNPVTQGDFASEKAKQVGTGAAFGAAVPAVTAAIGRVISPAASRNPDIAALRGEGVNPTLGQTMGGRWNAAEEKMSSLPIIGDMISNRRGDALEQFNRAAINRATKPIGVRIDDVGRDGVNRAQRAISQAYDDALGQIKGVRLDQQFNQDFGQLKQLTRGLTPPMKNKFDKVANDILGSRSQTGAMTAETFKRVDSELGNIAGKFQGSAVASEKEFGDAVMQLKGLLGQQARRSNPIAAEALRKADQAYANLVRIEGAANAAGQSTGVFTPAQLGAAVRMADKTVRRRANAGGNALMQDLSTAAQNVIGNKVPNSGTSDRFWMNAGTLGAGSMISPAATMGLLGGAAMYTSPAQRALTGLLASRPQAAQAVRNSLLQASPGLVPLGSQVGLGLLNSPSP